MGKETRYVLGHECNMQVMTYMAMFAANRANGDVMDVRDVDPSILKTKFVQNLMNRPAAFDNLRIGQESIYGWYLSEDEYNRLYDLVKLHPSVEKFSILARGIGD